MSANLLVELFVEELPPKALKKLGEAFSAELLAQLRSYGLADTASELTSFASPRRLGAHITAVLPKASDSPKSIKLMPSKVAFGADNKPSAALLKKAATISTECAALAGSWPESSSGQSRLYVADDSVFFDTVVAGTDLQTGLQFALKETLSKLPIPKVMSYQLADGWTDVKFVRPAHGLVALHGTEVVPIQALGLTSGRTTQGHRFEAAQATVSIESADSYATQLREQGAVIASFAERRAEISRQLKGAADALSLTPIADEALLDEVTALVERPNVLTCAFEPEFLAVPQECLILTMKANQKYFPLLDAAGKLTRHFLVVSNIAPADASAVTGGNERVVRPRLADAKFFFDQDRKKTLESRLPGLAKVVYHGKLGSQGERTERVTAIAHAIVNQLSMATLPYTVEADDEFKVLDSKVKQAATLAKCDLLTDMVGEFPELQGIMGGYYARHEGLRDGVAIAIEDHYKPRFAGDALPRNHTGTVVALADKLETLVGLFGIGQVPTGEKDPFALRRHALGVARILVERNLPLSIQTLIEEAYKTFEGYDLSPLSEMRGLLEVFCQERLARWLESEGHAPSLIGAALAAQNMPHGPWFALLARIEAVRSFAELPEAESLAAANKRVGNILKKSVVDPTLEIKPELLKEAAEQALAAAIAEVQPQADKLFKQHDYTGSLKALAALKAPVDAFFDDVMVNAEDPALRANRLALLGRLHAAMNRVADLSRLA